MGMFGSRCGYCGDRHGEDEICGCEQSRLHLMAGSGRSSGSSNNTDDITRLLKAILVSLEELKGIVKNKY